jgi:hypothetical protein
MPDPRTTLTPQDLTYAATALRAEAHRAERQAVDPQYESSRAIFEDAAKVYEALAGKLTRIAEALTPKGEPSNSRRRLSPSAYR